MAKPNPASKEWNRAGLSNTTDRNVSRTNPSAHSRRCGRCEEFARIRQAVTQWVWVSEVGDWFEVPNTGIQLNPILIPPHHENEHFDHLTGYARKVPRKRDWNPTTESYIEGHHTMKVPTLD